GAGAVSPLEERNVVGVDTFSIRTWKVVFAVIFSPAAAAVAIPQAIMNRSEARSIEILSRMCGVVRRPGAQSALPDASNDISQSSAPDARYTGRARRLTSRLRFATTLPRKGGSGARPE